MRRIFLIISLFVLFFYSFGQNSQLIIFFPQGQFRLMLGGDDLQTGYSSGFEINDLVQGCYDLGLIFSDNYQYQATVYVPDNCRIYYLVERFVSGKVKLVPVGVEDFDNPMVSNYFSMNFGGMTGNLVVINYGGNSANGFVGGYTGGVSQVQLDSILRLLKSESFESTRFLEAKQIISQLPLSSEQICEILRCFDYDDTKLKLAKYAYYYVVDPQNYYQVLKAFSFSQTKEQLERFIEHVQQ